MNSIFGENYWVCDECGFEYEEYGPQYESPLCGSTEIWIDDE